MPQKNRWIALIGAAALLATGCRVAFDDQLPFADPISNSNASVGNTALTYSDGRSVLSISPQQAVLIKAMPLGLDLSPQEFSTLRLKTKLCFSLNGLIDYTFGDIRWNTSDPDIATVDENGEVIPADGASVGEVIITAASRSDPAQRTTAKVLVTYLDTSVKLLYQTSTLSLKDKPSLSLKAQVDYCDPSQRGKVIGTDTSGTEVSWSSSDQKIAQIDAQGQVSFPDDAATGSVTITARSNYDPSKSAEVTLKINE